MADPEKSRGHRHCLIDFLRSRGNYAHDPNCRIIGRRSSRCASASSRAGAQAVEQPPVGRPEAATGGSTSRGTVGANPGISAIPVPQTPPAPQMNPGVTSRAPGPPRVTPGPRSSSGTSATAAGANPAKLWRSVVQGPLQPGLGYDGVPLRREDGQVLTSWGAAGAWPGSSNGCTISA